jgi:hypothetical protein
VLIEWTVPSMSLEFHKKNGNQWKGVRTQTDVDTGPLKKKTSYFYCFGSFEISVFL